MKITYFTKYNRTKAVNYKKGKDVTEFRMFGTGKLSRRWITCNQMLESLPAIPLFHDLTPDQTALLKSLFEQYTCPSEMAIFEQGDPATYLYLVIKGEVSIQYKPYDGPSIVLTRLHAGDVFGWSAVVGSTRYTSSIKSESQVEAIRISGKHLLNLVREHPDTGEIIMDRLARIVSSRWKNAHAQVQSLLNSNQNQQKRS